MLYILQNKKTGLILKCEVKCHSDRDDCNEMSYTLNEKKGFLFVSDSKENIEKVLSGDVDWYNSSPECPCIGNIKVSDLEVKMFNCVDD